MKRSCPSLKSAGSANCSRFKPSNLTFLVAQPQTCIAQRRLCLMPSRRTLLLHLVRLSSNTTRSQNWYKLCLTLCCYHSLSASGYFVIGHDKSETLSPHQETTRACFFIWSWSCRKQ